MLLRQSNWWQLFSKHKCFDLVPPPLCPPTIGCPINHPPSPLDPPPSATTQHRFSYNCWGGARPVSTRSCPVIFRSRPSF
uniref:Uncharacterized protein n=1 Tax=Salix viminalis TaxID=40686 RepID=A0A6N2LPI0_SALVM